MSTCIKDSPLGVFDMVGQYAIPQAANWNVKIQYFDTTGTIIDLTGYTAEMQVRTGYGGQIVMDLTSGGGYITLAAGSATLPNVTLNFTPGLTQNISTYTGMIYDIKLTSPVGNVVKFLEGAFELHRTITQ